MAALLTGRPAAVPEEEIKANKIRLLLLISVISERCYSNQHGLTVNSFVSSPQPPAPHPVAEARVIRTASAPGPILRLLSKVLEDGATQGPDQGIGIAVWPVSQQISAPAQLGPKTPSKGRLSKDPIAILHS